MSPRESAPAGESPRLSAIWAQAAERVIGSGGGMPWSVPDDLAFFKRSTAGSPVIMGRSTWESFPPRFRPLPGRTNIVMTRSLPARPEPVEREGALWTSGLDESVRAAVLASPDVAELWIIGGAGVYANALSRSDIPGVHRGKVTRVLVTELGLSVVGDRAAPPLGPEWSRRVLDAGTDERGAVADASGSLTPLPVPYRFVEYTR